MAQTVENINASINEQLGGVLKGVVSNIKNYVDKGDAEVKATLKAELVDELSKIDGLGESLGKIQEMADSFLKAFDDNTDGKITPEEILAKAALLQQAIDGVNSRVSGLDTKVEDYFSQVTEEADKLAKELAELKLLSAQNRDDVAAVKGDLVTNYVTKDAAADMVKIDTDGLVNLVADILFPETEETEETEETDGGDGAVE